ncbi:MAG: type I-PGING CRISPR-associated protein Cas5p [Ignavibacteria bacterium]|jgi:CRISPR-associated protein Cas5
MYVDINFLLEPPNLSKDVMLTIQPLAPLSMVNSMPGSYYKTEHAPDKFMLCGLFENILNLHLSEEHRNAIRKKIKKHYSKQCKLEYITENSNVGYKPILNHLFEVSSPIVIPDMKFYEDVWTQHLIQKDDSRHIDGSTNNDWRLEKELYGYEKRLLYSKKLSDKKEKQKITKEVNEAKNNLRKSERGQNMFPKYYRSPKIREFLITDGEYILKLKMTHTLFNLVYNSIKENNIACLGTSEGWVDISIGETI